MQLLYLKNGSFKGRPLFHHPLCAPNASSCTGLSGYALKVQVELTLRNSSIQSTKHLFSDVTHKHVFSSHNIAIMTWSRVQSRNLKWQLVFGFICEGIQDV